ncbi:MAG: ABC transporter ATP-binding protein, partial [Ruminiclostridium sp.]|nr:ABC transporter ATP-binding protein [Ruminiclostridium sp.]
SGICPEEDLESICFQDVHFRYGHRDLILNGISFSANIGQQIALVGESGCGKSTISKLLLGLYSCEQGNIIVNGIPVSDISLHWLREQAACVHQSPFFFADTLRENLCLGLPSEKLPTENELWQLLDSCCCGFVRDLPFGLDTPLEEGGCNLSQGQRQRLAIVQALIRKPRLLILDEATSALDSKTEYQIQTTLSQLLPNMITVTIAHRLSTIRESSQILVIKEGQIAERGTHASLLDESGVYAELWYRQTSCA